LPGQQLVTGQKGGRGHRRGGRGTRGRDTAAVGKQINGQHHLAPSPVVACAEATAIALRIGH